MINNKKEKTKTGAKNKKQKKILLLVIIVAFLSIVLIIATNNETKVTQNEQLSKEEFLIIKNKIELKIANVLLDGSVTDNDSLSEKIYDLNDIMQDNDWNELGMKDVQILDGIWSLNDKGKLSFKFNFKAPNWAKDADIKEYINNRNK